MRLWRIAALASLLHFAQGFQAPPKRTLMPLLHASEAKRDLPAPAYLLGASALWATYPSTIKCLFAAPGSAISPGEATLLRFVVMAVATSSALPAAPVDDAAPAPLADQLERRVPSSVYVAALELGALGLAGSASPASVPKSVLDARFVGRSATRRAWRGSRRSPAPSCSRPSTSGRRSSPRAPARRPRSAPSTRRPGRSAPSRSSRAPKRSSPIHPRTSSRSPPSAPASSAASRLPSSSRRRRCGCRPT